MSEEEELKVRPPEDKDRQRDMHRAEALLNDPLIAGFFTSMEQNLREAWEGTKAAEFEEREQLWLSMKQLKALKQHLNNYVLMGKLFMKREEQNDGLE